MPNETSVIQYNTDTFENTHVANTDELQEVLRPIDSLISKSEKAQQKLTPGTWQHTMLRDNLKALRIASTLLNKEKYDTHSFTRDDLKEALHAFASMINKTEKAQAKFSLGTSQHTLLQNRLKALLMSEAIIKSKLG
ncbi:MAG: hypothetical protein IAF02_21515 [Anaerolineae bacterium]|nr:hypothetical protein [Anaerolineae bacterium]